MRIIEARHRADFSYAIAVPAKNEEASLQRCLEAINGQPRELLKKTVVVLLLNNTTDRSQKIANRLQPSLHYHLYVRGCCLLAQEAHAGRARRLALDEAYLQLNHVTNGILLTTDADSVVYPNWLETNIAALQNGADAVAGDVIYELDGDALSTVAMAKRLERAYDDLLDEIDARLDPSPHNPWPRHSTESGASLAMWGSTYLRIGGSPEVAVGEDRALCARILDEGLILRHDPNVKVLTSLRLNGRAIGGAAAFLRRRHYFQDDRCDQKTLAVDRVAARAFYRQTARKLFEAGCLTTDEICRRFSLGVLEAEAIASLSNFSRVWERLVDLSPILRAEPLTLTQLPEQLRRGQKFISYLRQCDLLKTLVSSDQGDIGRSSLAVRAMLRPIAAE